MKKVNIKRIFCVLMTRFLLAGMAASLGCTADTPAPVAETTTEPTAAETSKDVEILTITATPAPTETPIPTPTPTPTATPVPTGLLLDRYTELFSEAGTATCSEESYQSNALSFTVSKIYDAETYAQNVTYYVVDIYTQDIELIQSYAAGGDFSKNHNDTVENMAVESGCLLAVSGDYYGHNTKGLVIRNGVLYRDSLVDSRDVCVLYRDGRMETYEAGSFTVEELMAGDPWQAWAFGPALTADGQVRGESAFKKLNYAARNPRCAIGYYEPGHYCFVMVDGRQGSYSRGLTLVELSELMVSLGCTKAYNLDGGDSAQLYWQGRIYNSPSGDGRDMSDIVYLIDPKNAAVLTTATPSLEPTTEP